MKRLWKSFLYSKFMTLLIILTVGLLWNEPWLLTFVLVVLSIIKLTLYRSMENLILYLLVGLSGATAEASIWRMGLCSSSVSWNTPLVTNIVGTCCYIYKKCLLGNT